MRLIPRYRTVTIRRSLFVSLAFFILLVGGLMFAVMHARSRLITNNLSQQLLTGTAASIEEEMNSLLDPANRRLDLIMRWFRNGAIEADDVDGYNALLGPLVIENPQISSLIISLGPRQEFQLFEEGQDRWRTRVVTPADQGATLRESVRGPEGPTALTERSVEVWPEQPGRPWFEGAIENYETLGDPGYSSTDHIFWTEPYFLASGVPGIAAAIAFDGGRDQPVVVALEIRLADLAAYLSELRPSETGHAFVLTPGGKFLSPPTPEIDTVESPLAVFFTTPENLENPQVRAALEHEQAMNPAQPAPFRYIAGGFPWWGVFRPYYVTPEKRFWIGVVIPEAELLQLRFENQLIVIVLLLTALALALFAAQLMSRRYSRPLDALAAQSKRIAELDLRPQEIRPSRYREVNQVARSLETMRGALHEEITARQETAEALKRSEKRSRAILETAAEAILTVNDEGIIESANPAAYEIFSYDEDQIVGRTVKDLLELNEIPSEEDDPAALLNRLTEYYHREGPSTGVGRRAGGDAFPIGFSIKRSRVAGEPFYTMIISDLTELMRAEAVLKDYNRTLEAEVEQRTAELREKHEALQQTLEELQEAQQRLATQEKLASLGALIAGIAHEMKNPLNFVNNFAELSREQIERLTNELKTYLDEPNEELREHMREDLELVAGNLEKIAQHGARANNIIQSMLAHSRGEAGEFTLTDLNALVQEHVKLAYHGMRAQLNGFNAQIETHFDPAVPKLEVVPEEIGRVVINLVNNAFFATASKQKANKDYEPVIRVQTRNHLEDVEIRIRDNGIGIPESDQEKIFTPFFTTKPSGQGTGLGLSLSYDVIVKEHGGTFDFASEAGEYTEFVVTLPKQRRPEAASPPKSN